MTNKIALVLALLILGLFVLDEPAAVVVEP